MEDPLRRQWDKTFRIRKARNWIRTDSVWLFQKLVFAALSEKIGKKQPGEGGYLLKLFWISPRIYLVDFHTGVAIKVLFWVTKYDTTALFSGIWTQKMTPQTKKWVPVERVTELSWLTPRILDEEYEIRLHRISIKNFTSNMRVYCIRAFWRFMKSCDVKRSDNHQSFSEDILD